MVLWSVIKKFVAKEKLFNAGKFTRQLSARQMQNAMRENDKLLDFELKD